MLKIIQIPTARQSVTDITDQVKAVVKGRTGDGICSISTLNPQTAILLGCEDSRMEHDFFTDAEMLFPARCSYTRQGSPVSTAAKVCSAVFGAVRSLPYVGGVLSIGAHQRICVASFGKGTKSDIAIHII